jgi:4-alpha-glucanotransferase
LNTHDMPPFATWWQGKDIDDRLDLGLLDETQAEAERADREKLRQSLIGLLREKGALTDENPDLPGVLKACLKWLGSSDARVMLINLEDLWLETLSQNVPGTVTERVNWQRKTRLSLNHFTQSDEIQEILRAVDQSRKGKTADPH